MKTAVIIVLALATTAAVAKGSHNIRGYVKKDGTYVAPSHATNPNATKIDNYSSKGNMNPHTGKYGTVDPSKPSSGGKK